MCDSPVGLTFTGIATAATIWGAWVMLRERSEQLFLLTLPIVFALFASALHRYPFRGRLLLFAVPSIYLLISAGLAAVRRKTWIVAPGLGMLLIVLLLFHPLKDAGLNFLRPRGVEEIRPVVEYVQRHRAEGDILYCYYDAQEALKYYIFEGRLRPIPLIEGIEGRQNWKKYRQDLDQLRGDPRVWILFSHVYRDGGVDEERYFLDYLDSMGTRVDGFQATGSSAYLYDLSAKERPESR
jgi:hypothetical protein